ncbi:MAG: hypothetical protein HWD85_12745 [Flavobacteriaceae bacterium]|nr:hypothetical protein [Flavobacteriaceae bacterium]
MKKFVLYSLIFFFSNCLMAQYEVISYLAKDGLPHDFCYKVFEDDKGYIWIATDDGLVKFNGRSFKRLSINEGLNSNYTIDIAKYNNSLAIGTWGGGIQLIENDSVVNFTPNKILNTTKINSVFVYKNQIYGSNSFSKGFYNFSKKTAGDYKNIIYHKSAGCKIKREGRGIFFMDNFYNPEANLKGLWKYDIEKNTLKEVTSKLKNKSISDVKYHNGKYYVNVQNKVLELTNKNLKTHIELENDKATIVFFEPGKDVNLIVFEEKKGKQRVVFFDRKTKKYKDLELEKKGFNTKVSSVLKDSNDNFWLTTNGNGVFLIRKIKEIFHLLKNKNIIDLAQKVNVKYFLTPKELIIQETNKRSISHLLNTGIINNRLSLLKDTLIIYNVTREYNSNFFKLGNNYISTRSDFKEKIKVVDKELARLKINFKSIKAASTKLDLFFKNSYTNDINKIIEKENIIWFLTNNGLYVYSKVDREFIFYYNKKNGLLSDKITDIQIYEDKIWVGTANGLSLIENGEIVNINSINKLPQTSINNLYLDKHNVLWIAHQKGYSVYTNNMFYNFSNKTGLTSSFVNKINEFEKDKICIAGNKGIIVLNNKLPFIPNKPPKLFVNNKKKGIFNLDIITYDKGNVITEYKLNSLLWQPVKTNKLDLTGIDYGTYKIEFRSRLQSSDWVYSKIFEFSKPTPWYKTIYFYLSIGLLILLLMLWQVINIQKQNNLLRKTIFEKSEIQKEFQNVRENIARDFHDELGNKLAGIIVMSDLILKDKTNIDKSNLSNKIKLINNSASSLYFGIKDFIWGINSKSDRLDELIFYISDFGEELFFDTGIKFRLNKKLDQKNILLPNYWSRHILLIFKEAMTNTLKYSKAEEVSLDFVLNNEELTIKLSDDGIGFNQRTIVRGNGINNMRFRAEKIHCNLDIFSNRGTIVVLKGKTKK